MKVYAVFHCGENLNRNFYDLYDLYQTKSGAKSSVDVLHGTLIRFSTRQSLDHYDPNYFASLSANYYLIEEIEVVEDWD